MDDLTVTTPSVTGCRWLLRGLERHIKWARMTFKPQKCKLVVLRRGMVKEYNFTIEGKPIPTLADGPVRSLGKWFCKALHDKPAIEKTRNEFGSPGRFKAWLYHHSVLPRLLWPLQVYSVPISIVEKLESSVSSFFGRWLGLLRSLNSAVLYGSSNAIQLPFRGLVEEFMASRTREIYQYKNSRYSKVSNAGIEVLTRRKWSAAKELAIAEENIRVKSIVGSVAKDRAGLGLIPTIFPGKVTIKEGQKLIQDEVRAEMEEKRMTRMIEYGQQGILTRVLEDQLQSQNGL